MECKLKSSLKQDKTLAAHKHDLIINSLPCLTKCLFFFVVSPFSLANDAQQI